MQVQSPRSSVEPSFGKSLPSQEVTDSFVRQAVVRSNPPRVMSREEGHQAVQERNQSQGMNFTFRSTLHRSLDAAYTRPRRQHRNGQDRQNSN